MTTKQITLDIRVWYLPAKVMMTIAGWLSPLSLPAAVYLAQLSLRGYFIQIGRRHWERLRLERFVTMNLSLGKQS